MSDSSQYDSNLEDDPLVDDASQDSLPSFFEEPDDESYEPSSHESDSCMEDDEPIRKSHRTEPQKSSKNHYDWKNISHPPSSYVTQAAAVVKEEDELISLDPLTIFNEYFNESFIQLIVKLTNNNASQEGKNLKLTEAELKAYFGMLVIMSFHKLPHLKHYWNADHNLRMSRISKLMRYGRFLEIGSYLCFSTEPSSQKKGDQQWDLTTVRPLVDHLNEKFSRNLRPGRPLSVNESTVRPKNREEQFRQCGERHFSVLAIGCAETGYVYRINVSGPGNIPDSDKRVRDLVLPFERLGCSVYVARKLSSFHLVEELYDKRVFVCCELKHNDPNIPPDLRNEQLEVERGSFVQSGDFSITKWKDSQRHYLYVLSTFHDPGEKAPRKNDGTRKGRNTKITADEPSTSNTGSFKTKKASKFPRVVEDYFKLKRGIGIFDQRRWSRSTSWKNYSWTMRLFYYMLDVVLINSHLTYLSLWDMACNNERALSWVQFRSELANSLIGGFVGRKKTQTDSELQVRKEMKLAGNSKSRGAGSSSTRYQNVGRHLPIKKSIRRCANCRLRGKEKRSTVSCKECDVGLCITCFIPFHTP